MKKPFATSPRFDAGIYVTGFLSSAAMLVVLRSQPVLAPLFLTLTISTAVDVAQFFRRHKNEILADAWDAPKSLLRKQRIEDYATDSNVALSRHR